MSGTRLAARRAVPRPGRCPPAARAAAPGLRLQSADQRRARARARPARRRRAQQRPAARGARARATSSSCTGPALRHPGFSPSRASVAGPFTPALAAAGQAVILARRPGTEGLTAWPGRTCVRGLGQRPRAAGIHAVLARARGARRVGFPGGVRPLRAPGRFGTDRRCGLLRTRGGAVRRSRPPQHARAAPVRWRPAGGARCGTGRLRILSVTRASGPRLALSRAWPRKRPFSGFKPVSEARSDPDEAARATDEIAHISNTAPDTASAWPDRHRHRE